jgi:hypothetical protein
MLDGLNFFLNWDKHSSVRNSPRRLVPFINETRLFSPNLAPALAHPIVLTIPDSEMRKVEAQFLFYYLQFTEYLETCLVNKVIIAIINDDFPLIFDVSLKNDAFKIYCDEAYHAQQSRDIICQIKKVSDERPLDLPIVLKSRLCLLKTNCPNHLLPFFDLFFVCVAETLVSQELREHVKDKSIHSGIQDIMRDHAKDEVSHALFFKEIMKVLKQKFSKEDYGFFLESIPHFLAAYLEPDRINLRNIFEPYLSEESITIMLNDCLRPENMEVLIFNSSKMLRRNMLEIEKQDKTHR